MGDDPTSRFAWARNFRPTPDEQRVIDAAAAGVVATFDDGATIRAELIRILMLGLRADWPVAPAGVRIAGPAFGESEKPRVVISGEIDLAHARAADGGALPPLGLERCRLEGELRLTACAIAELNLQGSHAVSIDGPHLNATRHLWLDSSVIGRAFFVGAKVGGQFAAEGAKFRNAGAKALRLDGAEIGGDVFLDGAECEGETDCAGLRTRGQYAAEGAKFRNAGAKALRLDGAEIGGDIFLDGAECEGETDCAGLRTRGQFSANRAKFRNAGANALRLDKAEIGGGVFLDGAECEGETDCAGLRTRGQFSANGAKFRNAGAKALRLDGTEIDGGAFFRGAETAGLVDARRSRLFMLECSGATFSAGAGVSLHLGGAEIARTADFGNGAVGSQRFPPATIKGGLNLSHARIGDRLVLTGATFTSAESGDAGLSLRRARIEGELETLGFAAAPEGIFDLTGAEIAAIRDDPDKGWPGPGRLVLDNLTYRMLDSAGNGASGEKDLAKTRIGWLLRQYPAKAGGKTGAPARGGFSPQPFEQMEKVLRAGGHDYAATRVAVERREWHRKCVDRGLDKVLNGVLKWTSDYGYSPFRAALWYAVYVAIGASIIRGELFAGRIDTAGADGHGDLHLEPVAYAIDLTIPVVDFGQASAFRPAPGCADVLGFALCQWRDLAEVAYSLGGFTLFSILVLTLTGVLRQDAE